MEPVSVKFKIGKYLYPVQITKNGARLEFTFKYNQKLIEEVKSMEGAKWHGYDDPNPRKIWSVKDSPRNMFQIKYLAGTNPYEPYDKPLIEFTPSRKELYKHQCGMSAHILTRRQCEIACEMGTGKTLAAIEAMEASGKTNFLWVAPRSALYTAQLEFKKWKAKVTPQLTTYEGLVKQIETWPKDKKPPEFIVFDESSRIKNPTAQRSQAAAEISHMMRTAYGDEAYIVLMSGSPAPKSPADWWHQCEVAKPGYIREGTYVKFTQRLAVLRAEESPTGGKFNRIITWKDDERKCADCGQMKDHPNHDLSMGGHSHIPCVNEVAYLYKRMSGLVLVQFKKDCLDLPEKQYRLVQLKPTGEIIRAASLIEAKSPTAIQALTLLRELSDGFQYREEELEEQETCTVCNGSKVVDHFIDADDPDNPLDGMSIQKGQRVIYDESGAPVDILERPLRVEKTTQACPSCHGVGFRPKVTRIAKEFPTPKEPALRDILEEHEEVERLVVYGAFAGTIDRIIKIVTEARWNYIKADGRGWISSLGGTPTEMLGKFQDKSFEGKICFIGQPGAAGMGLNLTASPTIVYFSNDFNAESRIQSEDRIHRPGMDVNRGATIVDFIHLPSDQLILNNLKKKRDLQGLTMGQLKLELESIGGRVV